jgi:hypothetical protein
MIFGGLRGGGSLLQKTDEIGERRLWCGQSRKEGGTGKVGGDRGGVLLKGHGGEEMEGGGLSGEGVTSRREDVGPGLGRQATPRPTTAWAE